MAEKLDRSHLHPPPVRPCLQRGASDVCVHVFALLRLSVTGGHPGARVDSSRKHSSLLGLKTAEFDHVVEPGIMLLS